MCVRARWTRQIGKVSRHQGGQESAQGRTRTVDGFSMLKLLLSVPPRGARGRAYGRRAGNCVARHCACVRAAACEFSRANRRTPGAPARPRGCAEEPVPLPSGAGAGASHTTAKSRAQPAPCVRRSVGFRGTCRARLALEFSSKRPSRTCAVEGAQFGHVWLLRVAGAAGALWSRIQVRPVSHCEPVRLSHLRACCRSSATKTMVRRAERWQDSGGGSARAGRRA